LILSDLERWPEWNTYAIGVEVEGSNSYPVCL
jgi:hypothetical protein